MDKPKNTRKYLYLFPILYILSLYAILPMSLLLQLTNIPGNIVEVPVIVFSIANILVSIVFAREENLDFFYNAMMILKLSLIPFFVIGAALIVFSGLLSFVPVMAVFGIGPTVFLSGILIGCLVLVFSAPYGITYLVLSKKAGMYTTGITVLFSILQFVFVLDVLTVLIIFIWKRRKESFRLLIALAILFLFLPFVNTSVFMASGAADNAFRQIELAMMSPEARIEESLPSEVKAYKQLVKQFVAAADAGDTEAIYNLYGPAEIEFTPDIKEQIDSFLTDYPVEPSDITFYPDDISHPKPLQDLYYGHFVVIKGDIECFGRISFYCSYDDFYLDEIEMWSEKAYCDEVLKNIEGPVCQGYFSMDYDYDTRKIEGFPVIYTTYDRDITNEDILSFLENSKSIDDFKKRFGEPNATIYPYETENSLVCVAYELVSGTGEPYYAKIYYTNGEIGDLSRFVGAEKGNTVPVMREDED